MLLALIGYGIASLQSGTEKASQQFSETAGPLKLGQGEQLTNPEKQAILRDLLTQAPASYTGDLTTLAEWFDHRRGREDAARAASLRIGAFIESECGLNLGGIRS